MKKILYSISVIAIMLSCGSKGHENENTEEVTTENEVKEIEQAEDTAPQELVYSSFDFLTKYEENPDDFLNSLKGNNITVIDLLFSLENGNVIRTMGYNGSQITTLVLTEYDDKIDVDGKLMNTYKGDYLSLDLINATNETENKLVEPEIDNTGKAFNDVYHTLITVKANGDNISGSGTNFMTIEDATITEIKNF